MSAREGCAWELDGACLKCGGFHLVGTEVVQIGGSVDKKKLNLFPWKWPQDSIDFDWWGGMPLDPHRFSIKSVPMPAFLFEYTHTLFSLILQLSCGVHLCCLFLTHFYLFAVPWFILSLSTGFVLVPSSPLPTALLAHFSGIHFLCVFQFLLSLLIYMIVCSWKENCGDFPWGNCQRYLPAPQCLWYFHWFATAVGSWACLHHATSVDTALHHSGQCW